MFWLLIFVDPRTLIPHVSTHTPPPNLLNMLIVTAVEKVALSMKPVVLAGPILRRIDQKSVTIWLATDMAVHLDARISHASTGSALQTKTKTRSMSARNFTFISYKSWVYFSLIRFLVINSSLDVKERSGK